MSKVGKVGEFGKIKKIALLLSVFLIVGIFASCNETVPENESEKEESIEYRDFGGQEFIHSSDPSSNWEFFWPEEAVSIKNDRRRARTKMVEEALNCVFTEEKGGNQQSSYYQQLIAVGDYHISFASELGVPNCIYSMYKADLIENFDDIEAIDLNNTEVWGTLEKRLPFTFGDKVWAYAGGGNEGGTYGRLLYNNELIKEFGVDSPQALYEQKKWTFDYFKQLLPLVTDTSAEKRIYGMTIYPLDHLLPLTAIFANGGNVVKKDSTGNSYFGLLDSEALTALDFVKELTANTDSVKQDKWKPAIFGSKGSTFCLTMVYVGLNVSETDEIMFPQSHLDDFGWIPFPCGPDAEYGKYTGTYESDFGGTVIMKGQDKEDLGYVLNAYLSFVMDDDASYKATEEETFKRNFFHTEESYKNYKNGCTNFSFDYYPQIRNSYQKMVNAFVKISKGKATATEALSAVKEAVQTEIDNNINNIQE